MSRTYRRRGQTHEYRWVLRDRSDATPWWAHALLDLHSKEGRHAIARFHSDAEFTMRSGGPPLVVSYTATAAPIRYRSMPWAGARFSDGTP